MLTERVVLEEEVTGPARAAAAAVKELSAALKAVGPDGVKAALALTALARAQTSARSSGRATSDAARTSAQQFRAAEREKAKAAQDAAKAIAKAEKDQERAVKAAAKEAARAAKEAAKAAKPPRKGLGPALPRTLEASGGSIGTIAQGINFAGVQAKVAELAAQAVAFAVDMVKQGVVLAAEMAVFKSNALRGFQILTGSAEAAKKAFADGQRLAREIGGSPVERIGQLQRLIGTFGSERSIQLMRAMADIGVIAPAANVDSLIQSISQIKGLGKTSFEEIKQISESGALSIDEIYSSLGRKLGKSNDEIAKLISAGKIDSDTGILGILDAIEKKTGQKLGKAAEDAQVSVGRLYERLKNAPADIFLSMEGGGSGSLQKGLKGLVEQLDPTTASGQKLVRALERVRDAGENLFADDNGAKGKIQQAAIEGLTNAIDGFAQGLEDTKPLVDGMFAAIAAITGVEDKASAMRGLGAAVAYAAVAFASFVAMVVGPFAYAANLIGTLIDQLRSLAEPAQSSGQAIGQGFVRGLLSALTGGISEVFFAGAKLAKASDDGARSAKGADVHSPSRKAMATARQIVAGYTVELGRGAGPVAVSGARLAAASAGATANSNGGAVGAAGGAGGVTINNYITIQGGGAAQGVEAAAAKGATEGTRAGLVGTQVRRWREAG